MRDPTEYLAEFVSTNSEEAFRHLVEWHVDQVYATALRLLNGDAHAAKDAVQIVFTDLARVSKSLPRNVILRGWLHRHTCFVAKKIIRGEQRRRLREQRASEAMSDRPDGTDNIEELRGALDQALNRLGTKDRDALLLRYFESNDFATIASRLQTTPAAAQRRISRALQKLAKALGHRGGGASTAAIVGVLTSQGAAPGGLAASVTQAALAAGVSAGPFTSLLLLLTGMKKSTFIVMGLLALGGTSLVLQKRALVRRSAEALASSEELARLRLAHAELSNQLANASASDQGNREAFRELLRLRAEISDLRKQAPVKPAPAAPSPSASAPTPDAPVSVLRDNWKWAGYSTPEATFETAVWAMSTGEYQTLLNACTSEARQKLQEQFSGKSEDEIVELLRREVADLSAIRLDRRKDVSDQEVTFTIKVEEQDDGTTRFRQEAVMRFVKNNAGAWLYNP